MLFVCLLEYRLVIEKFLDLGEQRRLLVVVMGFDELEPGETVADEVGFIPVGNKGSLVVDRIVTAKNGVV
jgi:hypothetical protein